MKTLFNLMFSLKGRVSRKTFWLYYVPAIVVGAVPVALNHSTFSIMHPEFQSVELAIYGVVTIFLLIWGIGNIAVSVKRLHDLNRSGLFLFLNFVPLFGALGLLLYLGFFPSYRGYNRHGPPPTYKNKNGVGPCF